MGLCLSLQPHLVISLTYSMSIYSKPQIHWTLSPKVTSCVFLLGFWFCSKNESLTIYPPLPILLHISHFLEQFLFIFLVSPLNRLPLKHFSGPETKFILSIFLLLSHSVFPPSQYLSHLSIITYFKCLSISPNSMRGLHLFFVYVMAEF